MNTGRIYKDKTHNSQASPSNYAGLSEFSILSASENDLHPAQTIIKDVIEHVLWLEGGQYDESEISCVISGDAFMKFVGEMEFDKKMQQWQKYQERNIRLLKRLMRRTGKDYEKLLMNIIYEHRRIQMVKKILDFAERLRPDNLILRRGALLQLKSTCPCTGSLYETLPVTERTGIPMLTLVDVPLVVLQENYLKPDILSKWSWLKSKYLAERLFCKAEDIRRILEYFPDFLNLQVADIKPFKNIEEESTSSTSNIRVKDYSVYKIDVQPEDFTFEEQNYEYGVTINNHTVNIDNNIKENIEFYITCESNQYERTSLVMLSIQNNGYKAIDFHWEKEKRNSSKFINKGFQRIPAFYFDKNDFRIIPGEIIYLKLIFCSKKTGIFNERWYLYSEPSFFSLGYSFVVNLFGHCKADYKYSKLFEDIKNDLWERAKKHVAGNLLNSIAQQAVPEPAPKAPYIQYFTEKEIFSCFYPNMYFTQASLEEFKEIYHEANNAVSCKCCPEWNYDIDALKKQILSIDEEKIRKELYFRLINEIRKLKRTLPCQPHSLYIEERFLLVKSVIRSTLDKIDLVAEELEKNILVTELPLEFNEVLVMDRQRKPTEMLFAIPSPPNSEEEDLISQYLDVNKENNEEEILEEYLEEAAESIKSNLEDKISDDPPTEVVQSELVRTKQKQLFLDSLYMQIFAHLCCAAEEIVGVIEGVKNLF